MVDSVTQIFRMMVRIMVSLGDVQLDVCACIPNIPKVVYLARIKVLLHEQKHPHTFVSRD
jgi:hypothetical protein